MKSSWLSFPEQTSLSPIQHLIKKLRVLRAEVMKWDKANKTADLRELVDTGNKIVELDNMVDGNHFLVNRKTELINLECHRANILPQIEST